MWNKTTPSTNLASEDYLGLQELPLKGPHSPFCLPRNQRMAYNPSVLLSLFGKWGLRLEMG